MKKKKKKRKRMRRRRRRRCQVTLASFFFQSIVSPSATLVTALDVVQAASLAASTTTPPTLELPNTFVAATPSCGTSVGTPAIEASVVTGPSSPAISRTTDYGPRLLEIDPMSVMASSFIHMLFTSERA
ncbi:conserved hypothetical protein [Ricinus communis]|uniref:Uncharacterized protein n=1 Tax=Ricinus communis TaxID=3988 RepID=B9S2L9_RICCO|nr:conserved hypothetical protein [Ricinus communis]